MNNSGSAFILNTNDDKFQQRQKDVFDQLGVLEKNRINNMDVDESQYCEVLNSGGDKKFEQAYAKNFRGKESIFKQPKGSRMTKSFMRRIPDFKKNPHKWMKYSLDDVKDEDMSEKGNTRAALCFLKEIENRKKASDNERQDDNEEQKIVFKKKCTPPVQTIITTEEPEEKPSFSSSKIIMPEYVIGQKVKKNKPKKEKVDRGKELKLDHLFEED